MDGPSHYSMAEEAMRRAQEALENKDHVLVASLIAFSQVHATLAAAAAVALGASGVWPSSLEMLSTSTPRNAAAERTMIIIRDAGDWLLACHTGRVRRFTDIPAGPEHELRGLRVTPLTPAGHYFIETAMPSQLAGRCY